VSSSLQVLSLPYALPKYAAAPVVPLAYAKITYYYWKEPTKIVEKTKNQITLPGGIKLCCIGRLWLRAHWQHRVHTNDRERLRRNNRHAMHMTIGFRRQLDQRRNQIFARHAGLNRNHRRLLLLLLMRLGMGITRRGGSNGSISRTSAEHGRASLEQQCLRGNCVICTIHRLWVQLVQRPGGDKADGTPSKHCVGLGQGNCTMMPSTQLHM
jgi:hypothetical protein